MARMLAVLVFLFVVAPAPVAWADDPPSDTTPTTPAPDPAPPVKSKPAPKPAKPAPKPARPAPKPSHAAPTHVSHPTTHVTPAPTPSYTPPATHSVRPSVTHPVQHKTKTHKRVVHRKPKPAAVKPTPKPATTPTVTVAKQVTPLGFTPAASSKGGAGSETLLIVIALAFAIACFGVASIPPTLMPRRAAYYVLPRQSSLVVLGVGLFGVVILTFLWTRAH